MDPSAAVVDQRLTTGSEDDRLRASAHVVWIVPPRDHIRVAADIVSVAWPTLMICGIDSSPAEIAHQLGRFQAPAAAVGRGQTPSRRQRALGDFHSGRARALIASEARLVLGAVGGVRSIVHLGVTSGGSRSYRMMASEMGRAAISAPAFVTLVDSAQTSDMLKLMAELNIDAVFGAAAPELL